MAVRYEINPAVHLTTGTSGDPGQRVFYLQAGDGTETITLIIEKIQLLSLEQSGEQFIRDLEQRYPEISPASGEIIEEEMSLDTPFDPLFRVGNLGLGYDEEKDMIVVMAREIELEDSDTSTVRIWCTRSQLRALCAYGLIIASRGRPLCPQCGQPMDPEGHFCPKRNGHKH